jgi:hypothetical protein
MRCVDFFIVSSLSIDSNFLSTRRSTRTDHLLAQQRIAPVGGDNRSREECVVFASTNTRDDGRSNDETNGDDGSKWRIWSVIKELETNGLSSSSSSGSGAIAGAHGDDGQVAGLTNRIIQILQQWGESWVGQSGWHTLLNKKLLLHQVEESIVMLHFLLNWLERRCEQTPVTLVDVCCGKGILSMLASYLFRDMVSTHVTGIIMLDKQRDINWNHILASNENAQDECSKRGGGFYHVQLPHEPRLIS